MPEVGRGEAHRQALAREEHERMRAAAMAADAAGRDAARSAHDAARGREREVSEAATARLRAGVEAERAAVGGPPDTGKPVATTEAKKGRSLGDRAENVAWGVAATGVVGGAVAGKIAGATGLKWLWGKMGEAFDDLDVWDLSGRKAAAKKKK